MLFGEEIYQEGDRVDITDPLTRTLYGTSGIVVAVLRSRGLPTRVEVQIDGSPSEQLIMLRADEIALA
jgi:hypothetical protein